MSVPTIISFKGLEKAATAIFIMAALLVIIASSPFEIIVLPDIGDSTNPHPVVAGLSGEYPHDTIIDIHEQQSVNNPETPTYRPSLFFREEWKAIPFATPITQEHVANEDLILSLHGPGADNIRKSHHSRPVDDPYYVWSGLCEGNWAVSLKHKDYYVDLNAYAKILWRTKQSGLRNLRIILKLADGSWLVSDQYDGASVDWRIREFNLQDIVWYELDIQRVVEGSRVTNPNLTKVDEIGFTDLMRGGRSNASSRIDWIEVYGNKIHR